MVNETAKALFDFNGSGVATEWLTVYDSVMDTWPVDDQSNLDDPLSCLLLTAVLPLPTAYCHLPSAYSPRLLPFFLCLLPTAYCHLPTFHCHRSVAVLRVGLHRYADPGIDNGNERVTRRHKICRKISKLT